MAEQKYLRNRASEAKVLATEQEHQRELVKLKGKKAPQTNTADGEKNIQVHTFRPPSLRSPTTTTAAEGTKHLTKKPRLKNDKRAHADLTPLLMDSSIPSTVKSASLRIVGGSATRESNFPYFTDLGDCGGSLIAPSVVLTAAHCGSHIGRDVRINGSWRQVVEQREPVSYTHLTLPTKA